jgi:hypothetical protein
VIVATELSFEHYYFGWSNAEGACTVAGLAYNGRDKTGQAKQKQTNKKKLDCFDCSFEMYLALFLFVFLARLVFVDDCCYKQVLWDRVDMVWMWTMRTAQNGAVVGRAWNVLGARWLRNTVYTRLCDKVGLFLFCLFVYCVCPQKGEFSRSAQRCSDGHLSGQRLLARLLRRLLPQFSQLCLSQHCLADEHAPAAARLCQQRRLALASSAQEGLRRADLAADTDLFLLLRQPVQDVLGPQLAGIVGVHILLFSRGGSRFDCLLSLVWSAAQEVALAR